MLTDKECFEMVNDVIVPFQSYSYDVINMIIKGALRHIHPNTEHGAINILIIQARDITEDYIAKLNHVVSLSPKSEGFSTINICFPYAYFLGLNESGTPIFMNHWNSNRQSLYFEGDACTLEQMMQELKEQLAYEIEYELEDKEYEENAKP